MSLDDCPENRFTSPLRASAEPPRLVLLGEAFNDSDGPVCGVVTGHPRRPHLRLFKTMDAALAALRQMGAGGAA